jgi:hypothetical protein
MNSTDVLAALRAVATDHRCPMGPSLQVEGRDAPRIRCLGCRRTVWRAG